MTLLTVQGRATQHHPAERGTLRLQVKLVGADRSAVLDQATGLHGRLVAQARSFAQDGSATWWGSESVVAWSFVQWVKPHPDQEQVRVTRFRAGADLRVKFRDFGALSRWAADAATLHGVEIAGVDWALTQARRDAVVREVRTAATQDAVERARAYATALGHDDVHAVALYEQGLRPHVGGGDQAVTVGLRGAAAGSSAGSTGFEMRPEDIEVAASVTADFETL
ncbi:SIMPL domain-containing protein [Cellulosimicrobium arenosum]|uniref:SIMPL domain-containing protein n=1 Tax=Cellulosimicrobium arenosum TaxID=2708133 RepID=A0A927GB61_9MICO|nr:SIMPL domain-containing protein [Cellulosimicrobium arenosum]MBD8079335.1 SIMPL domain-containing protein [Cellulosimicrobium arenosum]